MPFQFSLQLVVVAVVALIFAGAAFPVHCSSQINKLPIHPNTQKIELSPHVQILKDVANHLTIENVSSPQFKEKFLQNQSPSINLGTTNSINWFRFSLTVEENNQLRKKDDRQAANSEWLLYLGKQLDNYDEIQIFRREKNKSDKIAPVKWEKQTYGLHQAIVSGKRDPSYIKISLPNDNNQEIEFFMRVKTETAFFLMPVLYSTEAFLLFFSKLNIFYGMYYGLAFSMIVYNLFHFFFLRDKIRLIFIMYVITMATYFLVANELSGAIFPISYLEATKKWAQFLILLTFVLCICFAAMFLEAKKIMPLIYSLLQVFGLLSIALILALPFVAYYAVAKVLPYFGVVTILLILMAGLIAWGRGYRPAKYFLFAWIFFLGGGLVYSLNFIGVFPYAFIGNNAAQAGSGLEMVLLSLAIADRVKFVFERLNVAQKKREEQLKNLSHQLIQTEERERRRIAGRLHDSIGQALCASKWEVQQFLSTLNEPNSSQSKAITYLDFCIQETRSLTSELYPQELYQFGLTAALCSLAKDYINRFGLAVKADLIKETHIINEELQFLLYRAVSELLNNIVKHANAESAEIKLQEKDFSILISVVDDGVGFDYTRKQNTEKTCFGLFSIQERLGRIGGTLAIEQNSPGGTRVTINVPVTSGDT